MERRKELNRYQLEMVDLEHLVPQDHLLRKVDAAVDFNKIYEYVEELYCQDNGRPSVDPVVLIKMVVVQHLFGIPSLRRTKSEIEVNVAYRWFLGYSLQEEIPHFSTISYAFHHRFNIDTVNTIFYWILNEIEKAGYLNTKAVFIDGTHIKANANIKKQIKEEIPVAAKRYADELAQEVNLDREAHGKKPFGDDDSDEPPKPKKKRDNTSKKKLKKRKKAQKAICI